MATNQTTTGDVQNIQQAHAHAHGGHDFAAANKHYFDKTDYSKAYDTNPLYIDTVNKIASEMLSMHTFDKDTTNMMDFACGTGLASRAFVPHVKSVVGVDISQGMLTQFDKRVNELGLEDKVRSVCIELKGEEGELEKLGGEKFDIITCSMAFHHLSDLPKITSILVSFLKPGGALIIADNATGHPHGHHHQHGHGHGHVHNEGQTPNNNQGHGQTVGQEAKEDKASQSDILDLPENILDQVVVHQHGFGEKEMKKLFEGAGLVDFEMRHEVTRAKLWRDVEVVIFVAKGINPQI